ncbi:heme transporter hrg1-A-like [Hydractinia symbiolongicarpus]|uniref:heme transporter hrg1-A-like n=1 Tax=Hydractinia symbiolongicarpus TaxID=13093 RepID=UPI002549F7F5|nr:heme transporter hrg1-A-like [Hydractinia symbiolongicarpus]
MRMYHHKGWSLCLRFAFAIIGILLGFSGSLCFAVIYQNYHCSAWAFVSGVLALTTLVLHLSVWKDITYSMDPMTFRRLMYTGMIFSVLGTGAFIGYLCKGILTHESGVQIHGWFIVTVWGWMTWKWGFLLFWYSKNYYNALIEVISDILAINQDD